MHNLTFTKDHQKKRSPHLQACPGTCSWNVMSSSVLSLDPNWKESVVATFRLWAAAREMVIAQTSGQCIQPSTDQLWDPKKGQQFTLLKRITNYKSVNSESVEDSILSQRVPSWGSCHLVDSTWVTHLNWNNFANFDVECIGRDNDTKQ